MARKVGTSLRQELQSVVQRHENKPTELLQILIDVQDRFHYLSREVVAIVANTLELPVTQVSAVAEFYSFLYTKPRGTYNILLSDSITDHMQGKQPLMDYLCEKLSVQPGVMRADGRVTVDNTACTGMCDQGPAALVNGYAVTLLTKPRIDQIVSLIENAKPLAKWPADFFKVDDNIRQKGLLLESDLDPGSALKALLATSPADALSQIERSGLRGRGGAGFRTAMKWHFCHEEPSDGGMVCDIEPPPETERYVICNADEGEPGTFKDRVLLQSYAHPVIEGMTLCARIIGARRGFIYLRGEYRYLRPSLEAVLEKRRRLGLLGKSILGQAGFDFDIAIHLGAGAYICGEESALIESLEGKRGIPRNRPPYPVTRGYLGRPTVVNNVETFAAAARIVVNGSDWFASVGTDQSAGTKILSVSGDCTHPGIYEFPFGTPVRQILEACGAGEVTGLQIGGPSGTFIGPNELDRRIGFEDLATGGSFMVFGQHRQLLDIVQNFSHFFADESCGFCTPCRVGCSLLKQIIDKICAGHGSAGDLVQAATLGRLMKSTSHCGLGQTAANPLLDTLERFPDSYERRLKKIAFEPGFDLDGELETARRMSGRNDAGAHLAQENP
ncbi:MAG: NAD(P)H-dependent oxidoreductase subunit E [Pseudomonadota bacterium]